MLAVHVGIKNYTKMQRKHGEMLRSNVIQEDRRDDQMVFSGPNCLTNDSLAKFYKDFSCYNKCPKVSFRTVKKTL